jgi:uncharacterized membrane protein YbaN (DUF454 family)
MLRKFFKVILSFLALIFAIVGFLVPILPGWPFLLAGIVLISPDHGKKLAETLKEKWNKYRNKN